MNVSNDRMIELDVSENDKENFSFPSIDSDERSAEVILMIVVLRFFILGITADFIRFIEEWRINNYKISLCISRSYTCF